MKTLKQGASGDRSRIIANASDQKQGACGEGRQEAGRSVDEGYLQSRGDALRTHQHEQGKDVVIHQNQEY
jgi:hypothetical protein